MELPLSRASATSISTEQTRRIRINCPKPAFAASMIAILSGQAASGILALSTEIAYARLLGPSARGGISLCLMSIAFGALVGSIGGEGTIIYWASRSDKRNSAWIPAVLLWGGFGCALASIFWVVAYWRFHLPVLRGISVPSAQVILLSIPAAILFSYAMALASGTEQFRLRSVSAASRQMAGIVAFFAMVSFLGRNVESALWGNFAGLMIGCILALFLLRESVGRFWRINGATQHLGPTLSYGLRGQMGNLATFFNYRLDVFIVNYFLDPAQLGFYALGVVVSEALWQIPQAIASALFPRTARTVDQDATRFTCLVLRQVFLVTSLCAIAVAVVSPIAIPLVFGDRFRPSVAVIWWLLPGTVALSLGKVGCSDLAGRGKNGYSSAFAFISLGMTAVLDWFLVPRMGIKGAALASSVAYFTDAFLILIALRYELQVSWKTLIVPTRDDARAYRTSWLQLKSVLGPASVVGSTEGTPSAQEGD